MGETNSGFNNLNISLSSKRDYYNIPDVVLGNSECKFYHHVFKCKYARYSYFVCNIFNYDKLKGKSYSLYELVPGCEKGGPISTPSIYILNENDTFDNNGNLIKYNQNDEIINTNYTTNRESEKKTSYAWLYVIIGLLALGGGGGGGYYAYSRNSNSSENTNTEQEQQGEGEGEGEVNEN